MEEKIGIWKWLREEEWYCGGGVGVGWGLLANRNLTRQFEAEADIVISHSVGDSNKDVLKKNNYSVQINFSHLD